jgi:hypothetical protein
MTLKITIFCAALSLLFFVLRATGHFPENDFFIAIGSILSLISLAASLNAVFDSETIVLVSEVLVVMCATLDKMYGMPGTTTIFLLFIVAVYAFALLLALFSIPFFPDVNLAHAQDSEDKK